MKITDVRAFPLRCALKRAFAYSQKWFTHRTALLVRVDTDAGLVGWGECYCHDAWPAVAALIERVFKPQLVGRDALARQVVWEHLYNWTRDYGQKGLSTIAISGVDTALWDIMGKAANQPVAVLLGGPFRDRVPAYATGMYLTEQALEDPLPLAEEAARYASQGFGAVKIKVGFGIERDIRNVRAVRQAIGQGVSLMVDANHAYDAVTAIALGRAIEPQRIYWFEEPVVPEDLRGYRQVRRSLSIPIAGGEAEFTRYGFRELIAQGAVDVVQPDLCAMGGLSEALKVAALAEAWHVRCIPHVWGTGVAIAASLHLLAALPPQPPSLNAAPPMLELDRAESAIRDELLANPIQVVAGQVAVPKGAGLGIEIDERALERFGVN